MSSTFEVNETDNNVDIMGDEDCETRRDSRKEVVSMVFQPPLSTPMANTQLSPLRPRQLYNNDFLLDEYDQNFDSNQSESDESLVLHVTSDEEGDVENDNIELMGDRDYDAVLEEGILRYQQMEEEKHRLDSVLGDEMVQEPEVVQQEENHELNAAPDNGGDNIVNGRLGDLEDNHLPIHHRYVEVREFDRIRRSARGTVSIGKIVPLLWTEQQLATTCLDLANVNHAEGRFLATPQKIERISELFNNWLENDRGIYISNQRNNTNRRRIRLAMKYSIRNVARRLLFEEE